MIATAPYKLPASEETPIWNSKPVRSCILLRRVRHCYPFLHRPTLEKVIRPRIRVQNELIRHRPVVSSLLAISKFEKGQKIVGFFMNLLCAMALTWPSQQCFVDGATHCACRSRTPWSSVLGDLSKVYLQAEVHRRVYTSVVLTLYLRR